MGENSKIEWTDHTFNPWWGCEKVSAGCLRCYAESFSKRTGHQIWGPPKSTARRLFGKKHWAEPLKWNRLAEKEGVRKRVFCASMADVFEQHHEVEDSRVKLFWLINDTPWLDWLLLTKRPEHIHIPKYLSGHNLWLGVSIEDCRRLSRLKALTLWRNRAAVLFVSYEPALEAVPICPPEFDMIDWVICGGESGPKCRSFDVEWARQMLDDCRWSDTAFFMKQMGGHPYKRDKLEDFPEDLRIREFPTPRATL